MSTVDKQHIKTLEEIIKTMADIWPGDRENVMLAGAQLEEVIDAYQGTSPLINDLISLCWKGMIHLYEKDDYFLSVKSASMQAVNILREYTINDGNIAVEVFEKACDDLNKAMAGGSHSAEEARLEAEEAEKAEEVKEPEEAKEAEQAAGANKEEEANQEEKTEEKTKIAEGAEETEEAADDAQEVSLNDVASLMMEFDTEQIQEKDLESLHELLEKVIKKSADAIAGPLMAVLEQVDRARSGGIDDYDDWLNKLSEKIEEAVNSEINYLHGTPDAQTTLEPLQPGAHDHSSISIVPYSDPKDTLEPGMENTIESGLGAQDPDEKLLKPLLEEAPEPPDERILEPSNERPPMPPEEPAGEQPVSPAEDNTEDPPPFKLSADFETALIPDFISECQELVEAAEESLLDLEEVPDDDELINNVFRSFHTIKGTSAFMGLSPVADFAHSVETLLDMVRDGHLRYDSACADITLNSIDIIKSYLKRLESLQAGGLLSTPEGYGKIMSVLLQICDYGKAPAEVWEQPVAAGQAVPGSSSDSADIGPEPVPDEGLPVEQDPSPDSGDNGIPSPTSSDVGPDKPSVPGSSNGKKSESDATVRVNVDRLDRLIDMVGELVIAHSGVAQDPHIMKEADLHRKVSHSSKILRELQDTSLTLRMVPLKATFNKMNRLVRDLAKKAGKAVRFSTTGEDTEIDRNMVDIINEPLVHLLRNALDHGIEDSESRARSGKSATALVSLKAYQAGGKVVIDIEDDGRGMNREKILEKAISKGLVEPGKQLSDSEIFKMIFLPGFSTAEKVTDLSGRGVGMDVVRRSIDKLQGKVEVSSTPGKGTCVTLELPFTLAITDGMLVSIGEQRFVIPTISIEMTYRPHEEDLYTMLGDTEQVSLRGESIPLIRLHQMFAIPGAEEDPLKATLLIINSNKKKYALLVDEVLGQHQLVGKSITMPVKMKNISGGAILGDGRVGLILDTVALFN